MQQFTFTSQNFRIAYLNFLSTQAAIWDCAKLSKSIHWFKHILLYKIKRIRNKDWQLAYFPLINKSVNMYMYQ